MASEVLPNGEPLLCWHGDPHGDGHPYERPRCPEKPVRSTDLLVKAAKAAQVTGDAPGILAVLLAAGQQASARRSAFRRY